LSVENKLASFLSGSRDWERRPTNLPGVFLLKLPSSRSRQASIAIEINPVEFNSTLANQKLIELARKIDEVNPKQKEEATATGSDIFEI
jgi:hypothetical protein